MNQTGDLVLKGSRIVIPKSLQDRATKLGHGGHQGNEKTKSLLREKIWYPGMDDKVKKMIENCGACQPVGPSNSPEPMRITPTATEPWQSLAIDFYGPVPRSGQYLLVVIRGVNPGGDGGGHVPPSLKIGEYLIVLPNFSYVQ